MVEDSARGGETGVDVVEGRDPISVKRNLNLLEAFKTQSIPDKIHIQDDPDQLHQSNHSR